MISFLLEVNCLIFIAFPALEFMAEHRLASGLRRDPDARDKRRVMTYMLVMPAGKLRPPVALVVLIVARYFLFHLNGRCSFYQRPASTIE